MVSNIVLNYYGEEADTYRRELNVVLANYSTPVRLKVGVYPTTYGLGHRFHVFDEHGYDIALSPLILNLDDDVVINCDSLKKKLQILSRMSIDHKRFHESSSPPMSKLVAATSPGKLRGVAYKENGDIEYIQSKGLALTPALLLPLELFKYFVDVIPVEMLRPIDEMLNCEDILMNFVSAFLNENNATAMSCDSNRKTASLIPTTSYDGLSKTNTIFHRSNCIYWFDKVFNHFGTALLYNKQSKGNEKRVCYHSRSKD